ncbi:MAG: amidohydrolase family protein [Propionibacteriaceae bacterium]
MSTPLHLRGTILPDGELRDLWINDGRISHTKIPGARTIIDGGWIIPGFVDAHCHVGMPGHDSQVTIVDGFATLSEQECIDQATTDRDAGTLLIRDLGAPTDTRFLDDHEELPRIIHGHRHIAKPKRYERNVAVEVTTLPELLAAVEEQIREGDGWVKLVGDWIDRETGDLSPVFSAAELKAAIDCAHARGARVTAHSFDELSVRLCIEAGIDCIEHGTGLDRDLLAVMAQRSIALVPTMINIDNFPHFAAAGAAKFPTYADHMTALHDRNHEVVRMAIELGVPVYIGTDAGGSVAHGRIVDEIEELAALSSPEYALGAASWRAREWLGYSGLDDGAEADLLVFEHDPRTNLDTLRKPQVIVLRGAVVAGNVAS